MSAPVEARIQKLYTTIKPMGTTMKKKMALNDGESKIHGCQRFSFILTPL
jgi:hypothetical protein